MNERIKGNNKRRKRSMMKKDGIKRNMKRMMYEGKRKKGII